MNVSTVAESKRALVWLTGFVLLVTAGLLYLADVNWIVVAILLNSSFSCMAIAACIKVHRNVVGVDEDDMDGLNRLLGHSDLSQLVGKWIAVIGGEIVAQGDSGVTVFKEAQKKYPYKEAFIMKILSSDEEERRISVWLWNRGVASNE